MKSELQQKLLKKYPQFFQTDLKIYTGEKPIIDEVEELAKQKEIILPIQFGFECDDGWYMLLNTLMRNIDQYLNFSSRVNKKEISFEITQIKEKFGGLRFYYDGGDEYINGMVRFAESISCEICETCGSTNNVTQTSGWVKTLCENCLKKSK